MKKVVLFALLCLFITGLLAQTTVTVGNPNSGSVSYAPVFIASDYSVSQMIYTTEELSELGFSVGWQITHLMFQAHESSIDLYLTDQWNIRMMETAETNVEAWIDPLGSVEVFNGNIGVSTLSPQRWLDITLTTPFTYTGYQNLLIQVMDTSANNFGLIRRFRGHTTADNLTRYAYRNGTPYLPTNTSGWTSTNENYTTTRPNLRMTYLLAIANGIDLAVSAFTGPAQIPNTTNMSISIMNSGTLPATTYTVEIFETGESTVLYTVPNQYIASLNNGFETVSYTIPSSIYNSWQFIGVSDVTLQTKVTIPADTNPINNTKRIVTYIKPQYDIQVVSISGPAILPTAHPMSIMLKNDGIENIATGDYTVSLYEVGVPDVSIISLSGVGLESNATYTMTIDNTYLNGHTYTPTPNTTFKVDIAYDNDQVTANNVKTHQASWYTGTTDAIAEIGIGGIESTDLMPFSSSRESNVSQSIYRATEFGGVNAGFITHIMYKFHSTSSISIVCNVNVYLANYSGRPNGFVDITNWVPQVEFTQVVSNYDLVIVALGAGTHDIWIPLDLPFLYTGGDLVVMTYKEQGDIWASSEFLRTPTETNSNVSLIKVRMNNSSDPPYDPDNLTTGYGTIFDYKPQMRFAFLTAGSTDGRDISINRLTGPDYIPAAPEDALVISLMNMSSQVDIAIEDYEINIYEMIGETAHPLYTINAENGNSDDIGTVALISGCLSSENIVIPSEIFNAWDYLSNAEPFTLKVEIVYPNDDVIENNTATLNTALRPAFAMDIGSITAPVMIPSKSPISVTIANNGRAPIIAETYTIEFIESYISENIHYDNILYTIGTIADDEIATSIALGDTKTYSYPTDIYNGWDFMSTTVYTPFNLVVKLRYIVGQETFTVADSLTARYLRPTVDVMVTSFSGPSIIPTVNPISIVLQNNGRFPIAEDTYSIVIKENAISTPLHSITVTPLIPLGDMVTITIPATDINNWHFATSAGNLTFKVEVTLAQDADISNNTDSFISMISDFEAEAIVEIGIGEYSTSSDIPFNMTSNHSVSQSIYKSIEFGNLDIGSITHIMYKFNRGNGSSPTSFPVNIYMSNHNERPDDFYNSSNWVPQSEFTHVVRDFDLGLTTLAIDTYEIWIPLDTPFVYTGGDLVVMTYKSHNGFPGDTNRFFRTSDIRDSLVTLYKHGNSAYDPNELTIGVGSLLNDKPQMRFAFDLGDYALLTGAITRDATSVALQGVIVAQGTFITTSSANGMYTIYIDRESNLPLTFTKDGYIHLSIDVNTITGWDEPADGIPTLTYNVDLTTLGEVDIVSIPPKTALRTNYPNPFNPSTIISFDMARSGYVDINIYNIKGQRVKEVVSDSFSAGQHSVVWNGDDSTGRSVGSGVYFYRMTTHGYTSVRKMLLMK